MQTHGRVRLDVRVRRDALLAPIAGVLAEHEIVGRKSPDRLEHLRLLVEHRIRRMPNRGLHREMGDDLQQVVLDDIANRADLLVELPARQHAERFGHRDLDAVDVVAVPDRLEERVREPKEQQVLHGLLAEVVIDPEDVGLGEAFCAGTR